MMNKITLKQLEQAEACISQVKLFKEMFGKEVVLTTSLVLKVYKKFNVSWCAQHLLNGPARAEYEKINGPALAKYEKIHGRAWAEYNKIIGPALAEYDKIIGPARAEYDKIIGPARAEYDKCCALAFLECYNIRWEQRSII